MLSEETNPATDGYGLVMEENGEEREMVEPSGNPCVSAVTSMRDAAHCARLRTAVNVTSRMDERYGWVS
jgi:hypothetical protein